MYVAGAARPSVRGPEQECVPQAQRYSLTRSTPHPGACGCTAGSLNQRHSHVPCSLGGPQRAGAHTCSSTDRSFGLSFAVWCLGWRFSFCYLGYQDTRYEVLSTTTAPVTRATRYLRVTRSDREIESKNRIRERRSEHHHQDPDMGGPTTCQRAAINHDRAIGRSPQPTLCPSGNDCSSISTAPTTGRLCDIAWCLSSSRIRCEIRQRHWFGSTNRQPRFESRQRTTGETASRPGGARLGG
eukprot:7129513-Prymnesium_polylepis.2